MKEKLTISFLLLLLLCGGCKEDFHRVEKARREKDAYLRALFQKKNLPYPPLKIAILIFKLERDLEVWAFSPEEGVYKFVKKYHICATSGVLGPKRREGDRQIPEGVYYIDRFNPRSHFYLSLGINYPNKSDLIRGNKKKPGGDIFIHGSCVTIGCIPITDDKIKEVYWLALQARRKGQRKIPVFIFPCRLTGANLYFLEALAHFPLYWLRYKKYVGRDVHPRSPQELISFWKELKPIYDYIETTGRMPEVSVGPQGEYFIKK